MAAEPQKSIRTFLNSSVKRAFAEAKVLIREEGEKKVLELQSQLPTPEELAQKLISDSCDARSQAKVQRLYDQIANTLKRIIDTLNSVNNFLQKNLDNINKIKEVPLKKTNELLGGDPTSNKPNLKKAIDILSKILRVTPIILDALPTPPPGAPGIGPVIRRGMQAISSAQDKVGDYVSCIQGFPNTIQRYTSKADNITLTISKSQAKIIEFKEKAERIQLYLEFLVLQYFTQCNLSDVEDDDGNTEIMTVTADDVLHGENFGNVQDNLSLALQQYHEALALEGKKEIAEHIYALKFNMISQDLTIDYRKSYKVKIVPLELSE